VIVFQIARSAIDNPKLLIKGIGWLFKQCANVCSVNFTITKNNKVGYTNVCMILNLLMQKKLPPGKGSYWYK